MGELWFPGGMKWAFVYLLEGGKISGTAGLDMCQSRFLGQKVKELHWWLSQCWQKHSCIHNHFFSIKACIYIYIHYIYTYMESLWSFLPIDLDKSMYLKCSSLNINPPMGKYQTCTCNDDGYNQALMNFLKGEAVACQRKVYLNAICCAGSAFAPPWEGVGYQNLLGDVCNLL